MPSIPFSQMTEFQLRKRLLDVERALNEESSLFAEYNLVKRLLDSKQTGGVPVYARAGSIIEAIELCFDIQDKPMTKQQIFEELIMGGYDLKPNTGRRLVGNTLNYHAGTGRVARHGDLFGKPVWAKSRFVETNRQID